MKATLLLIIILCINAITMRADVILNVSIDKSIAGDYSIIVNAKNTGADTIKLSLYSDALSPAIVDSFDQKQNHLAISSRIRIRAAVISDFPVIQSAESKTVAIWPIRIGKSTSSTGDSLFIKNHLGEECELAFPSNDTLIVMALLNNDSATQTYPIDGFGSGPTKITGLFVGQVSSWSQIVIKKTDFAIKPSQIKK